MKWYVKRGFEDDLIEALNSYDSACILGLAGMGKTTVVRYVYVELKRAGKKVVYLTSDEEGKTIEFNVGVDDREDIRCISLRDVWRDKSKDEVIALAHAVVKAIEGTFVGRLTKKVKEALEWLAEKLSCKKLEKLEHIENIKFKVMLSVFNII